MNTLSHARAAVLILEHGEQVGLPVPYAADATTHGLTFMFRTLVELTDWALWMEATVVTCAGDKSAHHEASGDALEQQLRVVCVERLTAEAKA